jgi:uncharacterized protein YodC (DUF2158 family)
MAVTVVPKFPFDPGDVVRLRSGLGPAMMVYAMGSSVECIWWDAWGQLNSYDFAPALLELVEPRSAPEHPIAEKLVAKEKSERDAIQARMDAEAEEERVRYAHTEGV